MTPVTFTDATFQTEVMSSDHPVLVDVGANWCGPCRLIDPIVKELAVEYAGRSESRERWISIPPIHRQSGTAFIACQPSCCSRMDI